MTKLTDLRRWMAPGEAITITTLGTAREADDPRAHALVAKCLDRLGRATAALGTEPKSSYWCGDGWFVSANPDAVPPLTVGDRHWRVWIPATT